VSFSSYGAVGDGKTDDTAALQAALDAESSLVAAPGATYRIAGLLDIDQAGNQAIDWNGSTLTVTEEVSKAIKLDKPSGITVMKNLRIDGKDLLEDGIEMASGFDFANVDVQNLYSDDTRSVGFRITVQDAALFSTAKMTDCDCRNVNSLGNGVIGDVIGVSRCLLLYWYDSSPDVTIAVNGGTFDGSWGDDGDLVHVDQQDNVYTHNSRIVFTGVTFGEFSRRAVKGRASGIHFVNSTFTGTDKSNPKLTGTPSAGMLVLSVFNSSAQPNVNSNNHLIKGCKFSNAGGYDGRVVPTLVDGLNIQDNSFGAGTSVAFYVRVGDVTICKNTFATGASIYDYGAGGVDYVGSVGIGTNNVAAPGYIKLSSANWKSITCPP
jgi:uncharacterized protein YjbI with pentapeptide repeats